MNNIKKDFSVGEAAKMIGVTIQTLRRWDHDGKLAADRSKGGQRRYSLKILEKRLKQDLFGQALLWVLKDKADQPVDVFYCPTRDVFEARIRKMNEELMIIESLKKIFSLISSSAGEIGNNSFDHNLGNWQDVPGVYFGYDIKKKKVVLADRGQGILKTLKRVRPELSNHQEALYLAFTEVVTGRAPELRGNGLKYVRRNIEDGYFSLSFQTGDAKLELKKGELLDNKQIQTTKETIIGCLALLEF